MHYYKHHHQHNTVTNSRFAIAIAIILLLEIRLSQKPREGEMNIITIGSSIVLIIARTFDSN